jgi:PKHD-type hydroxylase
MILCIDGVLDAAALAETVQALKRLRFADGAATAGWHARDVKRNLQAGGGEALRRALAARIEAHELFRLAARPRRLSPLLISRYDVGMGYGPHVDDALMGDLRTDLAFTLFLGAPEGYDGGELVLDSTAGEQAFKLAAGALVLYPATTLHRVEAVTRGTRFAAVGWAQSLVRDPARRELLFDLDTARRAMFEQDGKTAAFDLVSKSLANLLRQWAEP